MQFFEFLEQFTVSLNVYFQLGIDYFEVEHKQAILR